MKAEVTNVAVTKRGVHYVTIRLPSKIPEGVKVPTKGEMVEIVADEPDTKKPDLL